MVIFFPNSKFSAISLVSCLAPIGARLLAKKNGGKLPGVRHRKVVPLVLSRSDSGSGEYSGSLAFTTALPCFVSFYVFNIRFTCAIGRL